MKQAESPNSTVIRWGLIVGAALIIGSVLVGPLSSYLLTPKPVTREQTASIPEKCQFTATGAITGALALGDDGSLYAASEDGFVYTLDSSGSLQWKFIAGPTLAGPTIGADGTIYVSNKHEATYAINRTGTQQWAVEDSPPVGLPVGVSSALDQVRLYTPWNGQMRAIGLNSRASDWSAGSVQTNGSVAILPNGLVVYPGAGRLEAVDFMGRTVWQYPAMGPSSSGNTVLNNGGQDLVGNFWLDSGIAVGADGTLYACAVDEPGGERRVNSRLVALAPDGTYKWEFHTGDAFREPGQPGDCLRWNGLLRQRGRHALRVEFRWKEEMGPEHQGGHRGNDACRRWHGIRFEC